MHRFRNAAAWLTVYALLAAVGVGVGHQIALRHDRAGQGRGAVALDAGGTGTASSAAGGAFSPRRASRARTRAAAGISHQAEPTGTAAVTGSSGGGHEPFTVTSAAVGGLVPGGAPLPLRITMTNTDHNPYQVQRLQIDVEDPHGCVAADNLVIAGMGRDQLIGPAHAYLDTVPGAPSYVIPGRGSLVVSGVTIRMIDSPTRNQDACKGQAFTISYHATATQGSRR